MTNASKVVCALALLSLFVGVPSLWAQWIEDGAPICTAAGFQENPDIVSDGAGGAIIIWEDTRAGYNDIYAQRVDASGAALWTANGVPICTAAGHQWSPRLITDGSGGAIITWYDDRAGAGNRDIYAQRVNASGVRLWAELGVAICTTANDQEIPLLISDGSGGAIIAWQDDRAGNFDIYAQRVNASGVVMWAADGVPVCTASGDQLGPVLIPDGSGGAIITWSDYRAGNWDIRAERVNASGARQWSGSPGGIVICNAAGDQRLPRLITDGTGGAIISWKDERAGYQKGAIYAQRVSAAGEVQWTANGVDVCTAAENPVRPELITDGSGGAIITWHDERAGNFDIYAQRVNVSGEAQWTANGVAVCTAAEIQAWPKITTDGSGGAYITWQDNRTGSYDIYAQRVSAAGALQYTPDGFPICTATGYQMHLRMVSDGSGGAYITWYDDRAGSRDIYAQLIDQYGPIAKHYPPEIHAVRDVPGDQGGWVYVSWYASHYDVLMHTMMSHYTFWRAVDPRQATLALEAGAVELGELSELQTAGDRPVIRSETSNGRVFFWELVARQDAYYLPAYGMAMATPFDSTAAYHAYHFFQVVAHTQDPKIYWKSEPDSGYSVDNLAPGMPQGFTGEQSFVPEGLLLTWAPNREADLLGYRIYRGLAEDFTPDKDNLVAAVHDTLLFDADWRWDDGYFYKLVALDVSGNKSEWALLRPEEVTGADGPGTPRASYLAQNYPNPFNPSTTIAFALAGPGRVSLRVYDAAGRLVRVLVDESRSARRYEEAWDGTDGAGRGVASGVYFYRLEAGAFAETRKMVLLR